MFLSKVKLLGKEFYLFPTAKNTPLCSIICLYSYLLYEKTIIKTNVISIVQKNKYDDLFFFFFGIILGNINGFSPVAQW